MALKLMYITNDEKIAGIAEECGSIGFLLISDKRQRSTSRTYGYRHITS